MKILHTSDWHLGNLFYGNDRLPEHKHFLSWLFNQIKEQKPDALLISGDVFDNSNPSPASQSLYYEFLANATKECPMMSIIIIAGNHDSASRLEAPRPLLSRYKVEIRGSVKRKWVKNEDGGQWENDYDDLMIPLSNNEGEKIVVLAVPYLRSDVVRNVDYSDGVNSFLRSLIEKAREKYPKQRLVMMAHMYLKGAEIAASDASEKITIGGQEEVNIDGLTDHPDYIACGHIHKRQSIGSANWAHYSGSVLPMSFAEVNYVHGANMVSFSGENSPIIQFLEYIPQHRLRTLPEGNEELTPKQLAKVIQEKLRDRSEDKFPSSSFEYVRLRVKIEKASSEDIKNLEDLVSAKDAVLCKTQKINTAIDVNTIVGNQKIASIEDIVSRDPLETLKEAFVIEHNSEMSDHQEGMLKELLAGINNSD